jgi:hypothetical protein
VAGSRSVQGASATATTGSNAPNPFPSRMGRRRGCAIPLAVTHPSNPFRRALRDAMTLLAQ